MAAVSRRPSALASWPTPDGPPDLWAARVGQKRERLPHRGARGRADRRGNGRIRVDTAPADEDRDVADRFAKRRRGRGEAGDRERRRDREADGDRLGLADVVDERRD